MSDNDLYGRGQQWLGYSYTSAQYRLIYSQELAFKPADPTNIISKQRNLLANFATMWVTQHPLSFHDTMQVFINRY